MKLAFYKAFQRKATWLDWIVGVFTFGKHSHVELIFDNGESFSISPRDDGARFKEIDYNPDHWDFVDLNLSEEHSRRLYMLAHVYKGFEYDYVGALFSATNVCIQANNKVFCSEVIVNLLAHTLKYRKLGDGCKYSPSKLYKALSRF